MTISSVENRKEYAGNGVAVSFATPPFIQNSDIKVKLVVDATGVATDWVLNTQYTLSGAGDAGGGTLTLETSPTDYTPQTGETLVIYTDPTLTQSTDLVDNDALPAEVVEEVFDRLTLIDQRLSNRLDRSLRQSDSDVGDVGVLPVKTDRASQLLGFDVNGDPIASAGTGGAATSVFMATVLDDYSKEEAAATLGVANVISSISNLKVETLLTDARVVYLTETGRAGYFKFSVANLSAEVAADTQNGVYVPPNADTTGASGAWVRMFNGALHIDWFGGVGDGVTDSTAAWTSALAMVPTGGVQADGTGGEIHFGSGTYLIDHLSPDKHQVIISGEGRQATVIKARVAGSGDTVAMLNIFNVSRGVVKNLTLDGAGLKTMALGICYTTTGLGAGGWEFQNVLFIGATTDGIVLGNDSNNPDVASFNFMNSNAMSGAYGSSQPSSSQIKIAGSNTLQINWYGGVIGAGGNTGAGSPAIDVKITGGDFNVYEAQWIGNRDDQAYAIEAASGQVRVYGCHAEGSGGFLHTLPTDPQGVASGQHTVISSQITNTGANSSNRAVYHEAERRIYLAGCFFNENVDVGRAGASPQLNTQGNAFGVGKGYRITAGTPQIFGWRDDGGAVSPQNVPLEFMSDTPSTYINTSNTNDYAQDVLSYQEFTVLSASDVNGPDRNAMIFVVRDTTGGGTALVLYEHNGTPVIINQVGTVFVTAAPGVNEIQIKTRGIGLGVAFRAGTNKNNNALCVSYLACQ